MNLIKKFSITLAAITLISTSASAKIINFGIKAGMNINKIALNKSTKDILTAPDNSCGWEAGVMAEVNIPVVGLCFDASLMYMRMNNSTTLDIKNTQESITGYDFGKNFLSIPVNIKYKFQIPMVSSFFAPYIFTGPEFAFKLDKNTFDYLKTSTCQVAWNIGLGLQFVKHLQIGASYGFGINNIAEKVANIRAENIKAHNNYWTITAAWLF